jgi:CYTH domain-containing protein
MYHEIERKFLVEEMPSLRGIEKEEQERYFIQRSDLLEEGLNKKGSRFVYESKFMLSKKERTREKVRISKEEFEKLKEKGTHVLVRDSYILSREKPIISIKKYQGIYKGLVLAEVEFDSISEYEAFEPLPWMGVEVTDGPLGRDARLVDLDKDEFQNVMEEIKRNSTGDFEQGSFL